MNSRIANSIKDVIDTQMEVDVVQSEKKELVAEETNTLLKMSRSSPVIYYSAIRSQWQCAHQQ